MSTSFVFDRPKPYNQPVSPDNQLIIGIGSLKNAFLILKVTNYTSDKRISLGIVPTSIIQNNTVIPTNVIQFITINELIVPYNGDTNTFSPFLNVPSNIIAGEYRLVAYFTDDLTNYIVSDIVKIIPGAMSFILSPTYNPGMVTTFTAGNMYTYWWFYAIPVNLVYTLSLRVLSLDEQTVIATIKDNIEIGYDLTMPFQSGYRGYITGIMPLNVPSGQYKLDLKLNIDYPVKVTQTFTFIGATLNLLSYSSLTFRNDIYTITFNSNSDAVNNGQVRIDLILYPENIVILTLGTVNASAGTFEFIVPYDIEYGNYKIRLVSLANTNITSLSNIVKITGPECADAVFVPPDIDTIPSPGIGANPIPDNNPYNTYESGGYTDVSDDKYITTDQDGNLVILDRPDSTKPLPLQTKANCILPFPKSGKKPIDIFNPRVRFSFGTKSGNQPQNFIVNNCCQLQTYNPN